MKYVLLLMGNLDDARCGETEEGPGPEEFAAFDAELEKAGVLEVPSLDEALAWAAKCPGAIGGRVEVRPLLEI